MGTEKPRKEDRKQRPNGDDNAKGHFDHAHATVGVNAHITTKGRATEVTVTDTKPLVVTVPLPEGTYTVTRNGSSFPLTIEKGSNGLTFVCLPNVVTTIKGN